MTIVNQLIRQSYQSMINMKTHMLIRQFLNVTNNNVELIKF